jgi:hypothetical protein
VFKFGSVTSDAFRSRGPAPAAGDSTGYRVLELWLLENYVDWGELYLTEYREYSHKSKYYFKVKLDLCAVGLALFLLFNHMILPQQDGEILLIALYLLGQLLFVTLQANNKGRYVAFFY